MTHSNSTSNRGRWVRLALAALLLVTLGVGI